jgi:hypothetical protein
VWPLHPQPDCTSDKIRQEPQDSPSDDPRSLPLVAEHQPAGGHQQ